MYVRCGSLIMECRKDVPPETFNIFQFSTERLAEKHSPSNDSDQLMLRLVNRHGRSHMKARVLTEGGASLLVLSTTMLAIELDSLLTQANLA